MGSIFYAWQSDRPNRINRGLIKEALEDAIGRVNADLVVYCRCRRQHSLSFISASMSSKSGLPRSNRYRGAQKRVFAVFIAALGRGWRHRLLIRRLIATTTIEMLGTGNVDDPTCHNWWP
jgi:hypothetical protein